MIELIRILCLEFMSLINNINLLLNLGFAPRQPEELQKEKSLKLKKLNILKSLDI